MKRKSLVVLLIILIFIILLTFAFKSRFNDVNESELYGLVEFPTNTFYLGTGGMYIDSFVTFSDETEIKNIGQNYSGKTFKLENDKVLIITKYYFGEKKYLAFNKFYITYEIYTWEEFINSPYYNSNTEF